MKRDWTTRAAILLIGLILVIVNLIGLNLFGRLDLTDDRVYSLSEASREMVADLEDPVTITAFFTDDLPAPYSSNRRFLKDKLDDYRAYGGQNIQYRFVDPADDDDLRSEAGRYRIPPVQIRVIESDNVQLKNAYMGVAIQYAGEREVIPVVENLSTLEYDITSAIRRLTQDELPVVGFLAGHGEPNAQQDMRSLYQGLSRNYQVQSITPQDSTISPIPDALLVVAPTDTIPDVHLRALDRYVMNGGRLGMLLNTVEANLQTAQASVKSVGIEPLLRSYGIAVAQNLVMDEQSSPVTVQRQQGFFNIAQQIEYPFLPIASKFNSANMMVNRLRNVVFYFVSTIDTTSGVPEGVTFEPLVYSSARSATQSGFFQIQPNMQIPPSYSDGPFVLGAAFKGSFPSAFQPGLTSVATRIVAFGDGDFINESIVGAVPGNVELGLNMVDWLVQDDALMAIRSKKIAPRPLDEVAESVRPWIKYTNMIGPPLLIILFGFLRWRKRTARQIVLIR